MLATAKADQISHKKSSSISSSCSSSSNVLQIKQDDKFFCRLLSKETSMSNPSFRFSSSSSVNVPFVWESQPGTPKYKLFSEQSLPPLTPPPSYHSNNNNNNNALKKVKRKSSRSSSNIFMALFTKMSLKKIIIPSPSPQSSSSSLSSSSSSSWWTASDSSSKVVPMAKIGRRRFLSYGSSSFDFRGETNEEDGGGSSSPPSSSAMCFGIPRAMSSNSGFQSSYKRRAQ
ncbi:hypothetical protein PIB30_008901 [Stylosanthes scabra]|uniref:Uncharacterized protein n=1 Tax=Stylosanthes scabra TaxID=79078 RepID=A0ABU6Q4Z1_9FABA|nr:hypothetical protein [Stylosanthes scabra]